MTPYQLIFYPYLLHTQLISQLNNNNHMKYIILILITVILFITQTSKSSNITTNISDSTIVVYEYTEVTKKTGNNTFNYYMKCIDKQPLTQKQVNNIFKAVEKGKLTVEERDIIFNKDKQLRK